MQTDAAFWCHSNILLTDGFSWRHSYILLTGVDDLVDGILIQFPRLTLVTVLKWYIHKCLLLAGAMWSMYLQLLIPSHFVYFL